MGILERTVQFFKDTNNTNFKEEKTKLIKFLKELKSIEANLWGVNIVHLQNGEEEVLEDTNHLIYLISRENQNKKLNDILNLKEIKQFFKDMENLKSDFSYLKKKIKNKNKLKNLISNFTIKLVDPENYMKMENVFLLERKLYEIIDMQDEELNNLFKNINKIKINDDEKTEAFLDSLKKIRTILAGHQDLHEMWNNERIGFSDTSNIIHELLRIVKNIEETKN